MKVLVCGGRDWKRSVFTYKVLDDFHADYGPITEIIEGGARGADRIAGEWADERGISKRVFPADWDTHGLAAGPLRNQQMLDEGQPDLVIAFPGGAGTRDMMKRAKLADVPVELVVP